MATAKITLYSDNKLQVLNKMIITYKCSPLSRHKLDHWILHEQANPLLGKFCLPGLFYDQGEPAKANKVTVNRSSNARQTNTHIFRLLRRTETKQRYWNSSCFGDHDATKVFGTITLLHCETSVLKFTEFFLIL